MLLSLSEPLKKDLLSFTSVQFSRSVMSDSLRPHESQHARPPCLVLPQVLIIFFMFSKHQLLVLNFFQLSSLHIWYCFDFKFTNLFLCHHKSTVKLVQWIENFQCWASSSISILFYSFHLLPVFPIC